MLGNLPQRHAPTWRHYDHPCLFLWVPQPCPLVCHPPHLVYLPLYSIVSCPIYKGIIYTEVNAPLPDNNTQHKDSCTEQTEQVSIHTASLLSVRMFKKTKKEPVSLLYRMFYAVVDLFTLTVFDLSGNTLRPCFFPFFSASPSRPLTSSSLTD